MKTENHFNNIDSGDGNPGFPALTVEEGRVLGCLIEKEMATPEYYPMTPKALMAACNQKSSRSPVVAYDTATVEQALAGLRDHRLSILVHMAGARGAKNKHCVTAVFPDLEPGHQALLAILLLRGQQSAAELRARSERLHRFPDAAAVEIALDALCSWAPASLVQKIPVGGGRHVTTYRHLFHDLAEDGGAGSVPAASQAGTVDASPPGELLELKAEVEFLRKELAELKEAFEVFRGQF